MHCPGSGTNGLSAHHPHWPVTALPPVLPIWIALQFFEAASVEGHAQAPAFAALGRWVSLGSSSSSRDAVRAGWQREVGPQPSPHCSTLMLARRYFQEVEHKPEQAMRCYKRALALDPSVAVAGSDLPPPSWLNNVLDAAAAAAATDASQQGPAKPATPGGSQLGGEDSAFAAASAGQPLASRNDIVA